MTKLHDPATPPVAALARRIAHDIRSPLGVITGALEDLARNSTGGATSPMLALASRSTRRLDWLARRMHWLAQATNGTAEATPDDRQQLSQIVAQAVESAQAVGGRRGILIEISSDGADHEWRGAKPMGHVCEELLHNALRHAKTSVRVVHGGGRVLIEDDGVGVPEARRASLMEPLATTSSGFGLWLCTQLLMQCDARLRFDPAHQGGARFMVESTTGSL